MRITSLHSHTIRLHTIHSGKTLPEHYQTTIDKLNHNSNNYSTSVVLGLQINELLALRKVVSIFLKQHETKKTTDLQETFLSLDLLTTRLRNEGINNPQQLISTLENKWILNINRLQGRPASYSIDIDSIANQLGTNKKI